MNYNFTIFLTLMILIASCNKLPPQGQHQIQIEEPSLKSTINHRINNNLSCFTLSKQEYKDSIHSSLPMVYFDLNFDPNTSKRSIHISTKSNPKINQLIEADVGHPLSYNDDLRIIDVNFDGYKDIMLLDWWGVTGNMGYSFFTFDIYSDSFKYRSELSVLGNPRFDESTKRIHTYSKGGMAGKIYNSEVYEFQNDSLKLIHSVNQDFDQNTNHYTRKTKYMKHGKLIDSITVVFPPKKY